MQTASMYGKMTRVMSERGSEQERVRAPLEKAARAVAEPFQDFVRNQSGSGWVLLAATVIAIALANSPLAERYFGLVHAELGVSLAGSGFELTLRHWVNDGLMAFFFFLLGLELKRELLVGQLRDPKHTTSIMCAAVGGMILPAALFLATAETSVAARGWAIPVATDTAFALVVLVLLGDRIPVAARAFLVGLAIVDDLGAILIIAFGYTADFDYAFLPATVGCVLALAGLNLTGIRNGWSYFLVGLILWGLLFRLGLHGTLTGVVVALAAPVRPAIARDRFLAVAWDRLRRFEAKQDEEAETILEAEQQQNIAHDVLSVTKKATAPLRRWEAFLDRPVAFIVLPVFAFMNAGLDLSASAIAATWAGEASLGILLGLLVGKPAGIFGGVLLGRLFKLADLPEALSLRHVLGIGLLGSIGFTMSLFIATLSFGEASQLLDTAKTSLVASSVVGALLGYAWLRWFSGERAA